MQILVLGMHRSGTSVVSRLLNMMGAYFAPEGISTGANEENPKGFWERRDVRALNDMVLQSAKADWHHLSSFSVDQVPDPVLAEFKKEAGKIILGIDAHRPWFLKEPRFCVLAPLWLELLEFPICIFVYRSPLEVARSLEMRNGFPLSFGIALWERYNTAALNATLGQRRIQVNHADLISHPVATARRLAQGLKALDVHGLRSPSSEEVRAFIDPSLYRAREKDITAPGPLNAAQRKLRDAFQHGRALLATKPIRFSAAAQNELIQHDQAEEAQKKSAGIEQRNADLAAAVAEWKTKTEQSDTARAQSQKELETVRAQLAVQQRELADKERLLKAVKEEAIRNAASAEKIRETLRLEMKLLRQEAKADATNAELVKRDQEIAKEKERNTSLEKGSAALADELSKFKARLKQTEAASIQLRKDLGGAQKQIADKKRAWETAVEIAAARSDEIRQIATKLDTSREEVRVKSREIADLTNRVRTASTRITALNRAVEDQFRALKEKDAQIEELAQRSRILKRGLDTIEEYFSKLRASRSFQFMVYTARRMGLVSRTPRRSVEAIKSEFSAIRKALKLARQKALPETVPPAASTPAAAAIGKSLAAPPPAAPVKLGAEPEEAPLDRIAQAAALRKAASAKHALAFPRALPAKDASVCFIVLHHSGEHHMQNLFTSFLKVNTHLSAEFCIVLHACQDRSREVIASFQDRLQIKVIDCAENRSFSYSNNRAAEQTNADYLVFLNDDIIFQEEVTGELLRCLQDPHTGLAGVRLVYPLDYAELGGGLQHAGIKFRPDARHFFYRPFNLGAAVQIVETPWVLEKFPAITGALVACRRRDFLAAGGFFEGYLYGYEDVDLSLSFRRSLRLRAVSANYISCFHNESATGRLDKTEAVRQRRLNNISHLTRRHGWYLRRKIMADKLAGNAFFAENPLSVAFAVTEATPSTAAGDFFSASELADACAREFGWTIRYLSRNQDWYDLNDVDVLVVLLDAYELSKIRNAKPDLVKIAWMRNWFERWTSRPDFDQYDLFLCSSIKSAGWLQEQHRKKACVFPLATNPARFTDAQAERHLESDYCFTGSYWAVEREIGTAVRPEKLKDYKFAVFGKGWEKHPRLGAYARGFVPYAEMPKIYASTRIVVDDANHVTKGWGSVNSRVFDALAAGTLVITNGDLGAAEVFDGELPTYHSPDELHALLERHLGDQAQRQALTERLRQRVISRHTYRHRARTLKHLLISRARQGYRIAFKIGAPNRREIQHWGDYHFALSLGRYLAEQGHSFRIDCLDEWDRTESFGDDVVIVLRGLSRYHPKPGQINLMWNISHPDKIQDEEYNEFDHVFVASKSYAAQLAARLRVSVSALLQCTDPDVFYPDENPKISAEQVLFVGNSRKQYREAVRFAVEAKLPLAVYGTHWRMFIPDSFIRGEYIDNSILRQHYSRATIVLNDHWPSMQEHGFASNRIFDAAAAGAFVLSDPVKGIEELFGGDLVTYGSENEFRERIRHYLANPEERRAKARRLQSRVLRDHTFAHRAKVVVGKIKEIDKRKRSIEDLGTRPLKPISIEAAGTPLYLDTPLLRRA